MRTTASSVVPVPIDDAFYFIADLRHLADWVDGLDAPQLTSDGPFGAGSTFSVRYTHAGRSQRISCCVTTFDPPHAFGIKALTGPLSFQALFTLEPVADGTQVTSQTVAEPTFLLSLLGPLLRRQRRRRLRQELDTLRHLLVAA